MGEGEEQWTFNYLTNEWCSYSHYVHYYGWQADRRWLEDRNRSIAARAICISGYLYPLELYLYLVENWKRCFAEREDHSSANALQQLLDKWSDHEHDTSPFDRWNCFKQE